MLEEAGVFDLFFDTADGGDGCVLGEAGTGTVSLPAFCLGSSAGGAGGPG